MDDGVVLLVGFQMRDFQRPEGLQGAGERVIDGGPRRRVTHGGADLPEGAEYLGPVEALASAVFAEAHAVQDATDSGVPRSGKLSGEGRERSVGPEAVMIEGDTAAQIGEPTKRLADAGLVEGQDVTGVGMSVDHGWPRCLTWRGHECLAAARDVGR